MKNVSESEGHFRVLFTSLRQYSQIIEEEQSQLVASCFGRRSHRGNMVSHIHNVFCSFSAAECLQISAIPSSLRRDTWSVKLLFSGEMKKNTKVIYISLFGFCRNPLEERGTSRKN